MSDNMIELLKIAAGIPTSRIQDDEECADSLTRLCGRAAEALASLQKRSLLFMREREGAREELAQARADLSARDELLREARKEVNNVRDDLTFAPTMQDRLDALVARIDALLKAAS